MKDKGLLEEFIDSLKDKRQKSLVRAYLKSFKIEDVDAELGKFFSGDEGEN